MPGGRKMGLDGKITDNNIAGIDITPTGAFVIKRNRLMYAIIHPRCSSMLPRVNSWSPASEEEAR